MKSIVKLLFVLVAASAHAQTALTLSQCHARAEENYPMIRQRDLIAKTKAFSVENAISGRLPRIMLGGQATYQSEVTQIPVEMPGVEPLSKDQYRVYGEISQTLYQGGAVTRKKEMEEINAEVESQKLDVQLYEIKDRINQLFFGVLLLQEQIAQTTLIRADLQNGLKKVESSIANGTAIPSAADVLRAELLRVDQRMVEMESAADSYRQVLGLFIDETIDRTTVLEKPVFTNPSRDISRPELRLFESQTKSVGISQAMLSATKAPHIELFLQGGYGRPGLNMLENEFNFYYLGGVRFNFLLSGFYTFKREKAIFDLRRQSIDIQKETFLFNTGLVLNQQDVEIAKLQKLIEVDDQIISLRTKVRQTAAVQLEEGVVTSNDFIREVNAEDQAKQNRVLHETQLLSAQAKYQYITGQY